MTCRYRLRNFQNFLLVIPDFDKYPVTDQPMRSILVISLTSTSLTVDQVLYYFLFIKRNSVSASGQRYAANPHLESNVLLMIEMFTLLIYYVIMKYIIFGARKTYYFWQYFFFNSVSMEIT